MKFKIFVHPFRPKVQKEKIQEILHSLNLKISETDPDIALIIGGDGTFSYYGRNIKFNIGIRNIGQWITCQVNI